MPGAFDPQKVLIDWKDAGGGFTISDAQTGCVVVGATGSGKTSGPGQLLARAYLRAGFGGLVLCAKTEERAQWEAWAKAAGRIDDLVIVDAAGQHGFNFLEWEATRANDAGHAGFTINVVALLDDIAGAIDNAAGVSEGGGDNAFFRSALRHMLSNLVDLPMLAGLPVSLPLLRAIANSAPLSLAQRDDPDWRKASACWRILREAEAATQDDPSSRQDFLECQSYWETDYPALSDRTRSIVTLMFGVLIRPFVTRPLRRLFCEATSVTPEDTFQGKVIIIDLPVQDYRLAGRVAALTWKWCTQVAIMRRQFTTGDERRPVFIWADEAQNFVTEKDAEYQAVARSAGGCTVYLTQQREGLRRVLKSDDATDNLLANLQTKWFCQNSGETNTWAADLLGERYVHITSTNIGRTGPTGGDITSEIHGQAGIQRSEQRRYYIEPARFTTLRRGGPANDFMVEAVVYCGGKLFVSGAGEPLPYKLLTFRQRQGEAP